MKLIQDWSEDERKSYGKKVMVVQHSLSDVSAYGTDLDLC
jgi:hypothetical protein